MAIIDPKLDTIKKEGTTQTFGQLVLMPANGGTSDTKRATASHLDTVVRLYVVGKNVNLNEYELDDIAKTNISLAAFSDSEIKAVALKNNNEEEDTRKRSRTSRYYKCHPKYRRVCCCCWFFF